jgi:hypothetical protein
MSTAQSVIESFHQARERTIVAGSARVLLSLEITWPSMPRRRRGGMLRPVIKGGKTAGKRLWELAAGKFDFRRQEAEGVVDFATRRYMLDYGSFARLYADGKEWSGRSGRALSTLPPDSDAVPTPLWLLDLLAGVTEADDRGTEEVRGTLCSQIATKSDLSRASHATPGGVAVPEVGRFEDLLSLPAEVWLDDTHIRRVRFSGERRTDTVELWDFGASVDDLDWTRLPTFRSQQDERGSGD